ncbi:MAG: hypothetical protein MUO26_04135 [Methanotrichaceae archaeon]|nr:hypothetical protein [Methanotrichaceae archaeon]
MEGGSKQDCRSCLQLRERPKRYAQANRKDMAEDEGSGHLGGVLIMWVVIAPS